MLIVTKCSTYRRYSDIVDKLIANTRFPEKCEDCWEWVGKTTTTPYGYKYGSFYWAGKYTSAHRMMYRIFVDNDIEGLHVDHLCRNTRCVNLLHLEAVTPRENTLRGISAAAINARKTHCISGHDLAGDNVIERHGNRRCRSCMKTSWQKYHDRKMSETNGTWETERKRFRMLV